MNVGDIKILPNSNGNEDFRVKVLNIFKDEETGVTYAEVEPTDFKTFSRKVPIDRLRDIEK